MARRQKTTKGFDLAEPELCLAFVNTEGRERNEPPDRLDSLDLFLDWAKQQGLTDGDGLEHLAAPESQEAEAFLGRAREFREALYQLLSAKGSSRDPRPADLSVLQRELKALLGNLTLAWSGSGFQWRSPSPAEGLEGLLALIASSAADLLRSDLLHRIKECHSETCSWMFIDESRNRSRRWCDMADCGNRAKARRFYQKHHRAARES